MANFLALVQELVTELGIGGANQGATVPSEVVNLTGQLWNAQNWIKKANNNINILHTDWQYMSVEYAETLTIGSKAVPEHSGTATVKMWDRRSFWIERETTAASQLSWVPWEEFRSRVLPGPAAVSNSKPSLITQKRDGSLLLNVPCNEEYAITAEFYKRPTLLGIDGDLPDMPDDFHRVIICEAAIKYGNKEAAMEVINGMEAEYGYLIEKLEGDQLIGGEYDTQHSQDIPLVMDIPGFDEIQERGGRWWL